jgi:hypothetical protein
MADDYIPHDDQPQRDLSPLGLYSHAAEMASQLPQDRGSPQQMAGMLTNNTYRVKPVEMEGFNEAFANQPMVTRDQLVQHFKNRTPPVEEKILTADNPESAHYRYNEAHGITLPGGENYREVLLKLPRRELTTGDVAQKLFGRNMDQLSPVESQSVADEMRRLGPSSQNDFTGGHWVEPNVLAHLRMSDRTGFAGEKILHVEEIQSDWGQKGRDIGFANKNAKANYDRFINGMRERVRDFATKIVSDTDLPPETKTKLVRDAEEMPAHKMATYLGEEKEFKTAAAQFAKDSQGATPGPYVTKTADWTDLALKRALKEAADGGYDKLVWTPGEEQAKRYSLSTKVERIAYDPEDKTFSYVPKGEYKWEDHYEDVEPEGLPKLIGKEAAKKLLETEPNKLSGIHTLEAKDLEVGGHGMRSYYDKIVPGQLQKLIKNLDPSARIGRDSIATYKESALRRNLRRHGYDPDEMDFMHLLADHRGEKPRWLTDDEMDALEHGDHLDGGTPERIDVHSLEITPKMREAVKRGLPAFASGGAVDEDEDEGITAYHGSPYDFPKFDISKIGTGEGNATYGHGLYFAGNENVAKEYREQLTNGTYQTSSGQVLDPYGDLEHLNIRVAAGKSIDNAIDRAHGLLETQPENADMIHRDLAKLMEAKAQDAAPRKGHMYEVRIKAHPDHFLDWDEVLEDQNDYIKNALHRVAERDEEAKGYSDLHDHLQDPDAYTGGAFYRSLAERGREKEASEILSQMGIKGIRYKDAASRFKNGEPSYNYVVFNHDHVDIKRKYARGGAVDVG